MAETTVSDDVSVKTSIESNRTVISVSGTKDMAVIVYSDSGERVYLPPEETESDGNSSYRSADGPYEGIQAEGPYGSSRQSDASVGMNETASGFRIVHTEPITDMRFLR